MTPVLGLNNPKETVPPPGAVAPAGDPQENQTASSDDKPPAEDPPVELHQSGNGDKAVNFFDSIGELQETAVGLAFASEKEQNIIDDLEAVHKDRMKDLESHHQAREDYQKALIKITEGRINQETRALNEALTKTSTLEQEQKSLNDDFQKVSNEINLISLEISQARLKYEKDFFDSEITRLQDKERRKAAVEDLSEEFELAEQVYNLKQREWKLNRAEFQRIADDADAERTKVEQQLHEVSERLQRFQQFGVSRTTAGFLVHAGYASFAAVGALIAGFFHQRQNQTGDFLTKIIEGVRNLIGLSRGGWSVWLPLFNLTLLIGFGIFVITMTTVVMHWLIGKLDANWPKRPVPRRRNENKGFFDVLKRFASRVGSVFQSDGQDTQPASRNRSSKDDSPEIDRGAFIQLLAHMPYIIGAAVAFFFFAALGLAKDGQTAGTVGPLEISSTYIGVIFLTLSTSAAILYVTNVIEPRWRRYDIKQQRKNQPGEKANDVESGLAHTLRLNWEFIVLVLALIVSLAMSAFLPVDPRYSSWALGSVAIFMSLASLGLAYGLVQRGLFRDSDVLEGKRQGYRKQADYYSQYPKIEGVFDNFDSKEVGERFRQTRLTQHKLDELRMLSQLHKIYSDDFADDTKLEDFLTQFVSTDISMQGMRYRTQLLDPLLDPLNVRFSMAPEKIKLIYESRERRGLIISKLNTIREELGTNRSHTEKLKGNIDQLFNLLLEQELELITVKQMFSERRQEMDVKHKKEIMNLKSAYRIGKAAWELMHERRVNGAAA
jgi:hypothetical protein